MRPVLYDHEIALISMDQYCIHGCDRSMGTMQQMWPMATSTFLVNEEDNLAVRLISLPCCQHVK